MATPSQKLVVVLAFVAAFLSLLGAALEFVRRGNVRLTLVGGGLLMLALGISGVARLSRTRR